MENKNVNVVFFVIQGSMIKSFPKTVVDTTSMCHSLTYEIPSDSTFKEMFRVIFNMKESDPTVLLENFRYVMGGKMIGSDIKLNEKISEYVKDGKLMIHSCIGSFNGTQLSKYWNNYPN